MMVAGPNITAPTSALMLGCVLMYSMMSRARDVGLLWLLPAAAP